MLITGTDTKIGLRTLQSAAGIKSGMQREQGFMPGSANKLSEFFQQGADARAEGVKRADNPYDLQTEEHSEWNAGWCATFDLDEDDDPQSDREQPADKLENDQH